MERCDSTNTLVRAMVADLPATAAPRVVAIADEQTAGRGRLDRRWEARPGSALMLSVAHEAPGRPELLSALPLAMGLAALEAIGEVTGVEPRLKWPNDVVVDAPGQRWLKLGGILGESFDDPRGPAAAASSVTTSSATSSGTTGRVAVLGIGINTGWESPRSDLPEATSLNLLIGRTVDRRALAHELLVRYQRWWRRLLVGDGAAFQAALHERSATLGQRVRGAAHLGAGRNGHVDHRRRRPGGERRPGRPQRGDRGRCGASARPRVADRATGSRTAPEVVDDPDPQGPGGACGSGVAARSWVR